MAECCLEAAAQASWAVLQEFGMGISVQAVLDVSEEPTAFVPCFGGPPKLPFCDPWLTSVDIKRSCEILRRKEAASLIVSYVGLSKQENLCSFYPRPILTHFSSRGFMNIVSPWQVLHWECQPPPHGPGRQSFILARGSWRFGYSLQSHLGGA